MSDTTPSRRDQEPRLTSAELAQTAGVDEGVVADLVAHAILRPDSGGHKPADVYRTRYAALATQSGITTAELAASIATGTARASGSRATTAGACSASWCLVCAPTRTTSMGR
jgi:hypothetical protein